MKRYSVLVSLAVLLAFFTLVVGACATTRMTTDYSADETVECESWQSGAGGGECVDRCRPGERYAHDIYWQYLGRGKMGVCVSSTSTPYYAYEATANGVTKCEVGTIPVKEGYCASICPEGEKWDNGCVSTCNPGDMWNLATHRCETPICTPPRAWNPETVDCECPPELVDNGKRCLIKKEAPPEPEPTKAPKGFSH